MEIRVLQGVKHFLGIVFLYDSPHGAYEAALTAEGAVRFFHRHMVRRGYDDLVAAVGKGQGLDALDVLAGADAAAAFDTF